MPPPGTQPASQACAPTGNPTIDPLVPRLELNPLSSIHCATPARARCLNLTSFIHLFAYSATTYKYLLQVRYNAKCPVYKDKSLPLGNF